jgi:phosphoglycolate phosphatase-like HAD superfamily hydrolase
MAYKLTVRPLIIFDYDGTLVDTTYRDYMVLVSVCKLNNLPLPSYRKFKAMLKQRLRGQDIFRLLNPSLSLERIRKYDRIRREMIYNNKFVRYEKIFPQTATVLRILKNNGLKISVASNRLSSDSFFSSLKKFNILKLINYYICAADLFPRLYDKWLEDKLTSDDLIQAKLQMYKKIIGDAPNDAESIFIISDCALDFIASSSLHVKRVGVLTGSSSYQELLPLADTIVKDLSEAVKFIQVSVNQGGADYLAK